MGGGGGGGGGAADDGGEARASSPKPKRARAGAGMPGAGQLLAVAGSSAAVHCPKPGNQEEVDPSLRADAGVVGPLFPEAPLAIQQAFDASGGGGIDGGALDFPAILACRLSDLTDDLLLLIFRQPHLGSLSVVRTAALSQRFKNLWRSARVVNISQYDFRAVGEAWTPLQRRLFVQFASSLLDQSGDDIDSFSLNMSGGDSTFHHILHRGLHRRPLFIDISSDFLKPVFKLGSGSHTSRLTTIRLFGVTLPKEFELHLSNCPVLVELIIEACKCLFENVKSSTLRRFAGIANARAKFASSFNLIINAPCLQSLSLVLPFGRSCNHLVDIDDEKTLRSLDQVRIELLTEKETDTRVSAQETETKAAFINSIKSLTSKFVSVTHLFLSGFSNMVLTQELDQPFIVLERLNRLCLAYCDIGSELQALAGVTRKCPNLELLQFYQCKFLEPPQNEEANRSRQENKMNLDNLKYVKVNYEDEASINGIRMKIASLISDVASQTGWMYEKRVESKTLVFSRIEQ